VGWCPLALPSCICFIKTCPVVLELKPTNFRKDIVLKWMTVMRWGDLRKRDHSEDLDVDVRIILICTSKKWDLEA
jgi:hypothetical protein